MANRVTEVRYSSNLENLFPEVPTYHPTLEGGGGAQIRYIPAARSRPAANPELHAGAGGEAEIEKLQNVVKVHKELLKFIYGNLTKQKNKEDTIDYSIIIQTTGQEDIIKSLLKDISLFNLQNMTIKPIDFDANTKIVQANAWINGNGGGNDVLRRRRAEALSQFSPDTVSISDKGTYSKQEGGQYKLTTDTNGNDVTDGEEITKEALFDMQHPELVGGAPEPVHRNDAVEFVRKLIDQIKNTLFSHEFTMAAVKMSKNMKDYIDSIVQTLTQESARSDADSAALRGLSGVEMPTVDELFGED